MEICQGEKFIINNDILSKEKFKEEKVIGSTNIYEVIRVIEGIPLFLEDHMKRMMRSLEIMDMDHRIQKEYLEKSIKELIKANGNKEGNVKIVFNGDKNNLAGYYIPHHYPEHKEYIEGVDTILYFAERENPNAKVINNNLRNNVNEALNKCGAYEAILIDKHNKVTEGSRSNIFMVKGETLITSTIDKVLPGITRQFILKVAKITGINIEERNLSVDELKSVDGLFISGTSPKVLPIKKVDDSAFHSANNVVVKKIYDGYNKLINEYIDERKK